MTLAERHQDFAALHERGTFVIPNPWDCGSARVMAALGAKALATSSAAHAFTLGRPDMGGVSRDEALSHAEAILAATDLPVSGDFENGFSDDPDGVAETVRMAGEIGLSGVSIENTIMTGDKPSYDFAQALDRVKAGVDAARSLDRPFVFCARADGVMNGHYDFAEAMRRAKAFAVAGADLIYAPVCGGRAELAQLVRAIDKPINALAAGPVEQLTLADLAEIGVRRVSLGSKIARVTHQHLVATTMAVMAGDFTVLASAASGEVIDQLLNQGLHK